MSHRLLDRCTSVIGCCRMDVQSASLSLSSTVRPVFPWRQEPGSSEKLLQALYSPVAQQMLMVHWANELHRSPPRSDPESNHGPRPPSQIGPAANAWSRSRTSGCHQSYGGPVRTPSVGYSQAPNRWKMLSCSIPLSVGSIARGFEETGW